MISPRLESPKPAEFSFPFSEKKRALVALDSTTNNGVIRDMSDMAILGYDKETISIREATVLDITGALDGGTTEDYRSLLFNSLGVDANSETLPNSQLEQLKGFLEQAITFVEEELEILVPRSVKNKIQGLKTDKTSDFLNLLKGRTANQYFICAIIKVTAAISLYQENPKLHDLEAKSDRFAEALSQEITDFRTNTRSLETGDNHLQMRIGSEVVAQPESFYFRFKDWRRIVGKLLRKPSLQTETLVNDGIQSKIIIENPADSFEDIALWFMDLEEKEGSLFSEIKFFKESSNTTADADRKDYKIKGLFDGTPFEVQVVSEEGNFNNEKGASHHKVYEGLQKLLVSFRLFGYLSKNIVERKVKHLAHDILGATVSDIWERFNEHMFLNEQTGRYHSYDYEIRTLHTGFHSEDYTRKRHCGLIKNIKERAKKFPEFELLDDTFLSDLLTDLCVSAPMVDLLKRDDSLREKVIRFLKDIPGVSVIISESLALQLEKISFDTDFVCYVLKHHCFPIKLGGKTVERKMKKDFCNYLKGKKSFLVLYNLLEFQLKSEAALET